MAPEAPSQPGVVASLRKPKPFEKLKRVLCFAGPEPKVTHGAVDPAKHPRPREQELHGGPATSMATPRAAAIQLEARSSPSPTMQRVSDARSVEFTPPTSRRLTAKAGEIISPHPLEHPGPSSMSAVNSEDQPPASNEGPSILHSQLSSPAITGTGRSALVTNLSSPIPTMDRPLSSPAAAGASRNSCGSKPERSTWGTQPGAPSAHAHHDRSSAGSTAKPHARRSFDKPRGPRHFSWPLSTVILEGEGAADGLQGQTISARDTARNPGSRARGSSRHTGGGASHMGSAASLPSPKYPPPTRLAPGHPEMSMDELVEALRCNNAGGGSGRHRVSGLQNFAIMAQQLYADGRSLGEARANLRKQTRTMLECPGL